MADKLGLPFNWRPLSVEHVLVVTCEEVLGDDVAMLGMGTPRKSFRQFEIEIPEEMFQWLTLPERKQLDFTFRHILGAQLKETSSE